ncbi:MAG TPA: hypothetical protein VHB51_03055 [Candidatus Saccharimonadales bacterium]|nr:hypothetical protein [Candidatus Saccharimonadales bacterium]
MLTPDYRSAQERAAEFRGEFVHPMHQRAARPSLAPSVFDDGTSDQAVSATLRFGAAVENVPAVSRELLRHPGYPSAMAREEVGPNVPFVTFEPGKNIIMRGIFVSGAAYDEGDPRWTATAWVEGRDNDGDPHTLTLFDMGITPDGTGTAWSEAITIIEDRL